MSDAFGYHDEPDYEAMIGGFNCRGWQDGPPEIGGGDLQPPPERETYDFNDMDRDQGCAAIVDARRSAALSSDENEGVNLSDFHAYMPGGNFIFAPTREFWAATNVNHRLKPMKVLDSRGRPIMGDDGKPKYIPAATWLARERPVETMTWAPGEPMIVNDSLVSEGGWIRRKGVSCFNLYRPPIVTKGSAALAGKWVDHVEKVYPTDANHIIQWLAQRVQRPAEKINHSIVLGGSQGIGKDTMLDPARYAVGPWNCSEVSPEQLLGRFNGFRKSVIMRVSEARDLGDLNRYAFYEHTKTLMAAPPEMLLVDEKHRHEHHIFNVVGVIITTNNKTDGVYLPPDDRRHYVAWSDLTKESFGEDYWQDLWAWLDSGGREHVAEYLRTLDLSGFNPKAPPPKTAAWHDIVNSNRAPEDAELADALDGIKSPDATTLTAVIASPNCSMAFADFLRDRKNSRKISHRLETGGEGPAHNPAAKDGNWVVKGKRQVIYARKGLSAHDRLLAADRLTKQ